MMQWNGEWLDNITKSLVEVVFVEWEWMRSQTGFIAMTRPAASNFDEMRVME